MTAHALPTESVELPSTRQIVPQAGGGGAVRIRAIGGVLATRFSGLEEIPHQLAGASGGWIAAALILPVASTTCSPSPSSPASATGAPAGTQAQACRWPFRA